MSQTRDDALDLKDDLESMLDRFDEVLTVAETTGFNAITHKLREASGPLRQAFEAAEQYEAGDLEPVGGWDGED